MSKTTAGACSFHLVSSGSLLSEVPERAPQSVIHPKWCESGFVLSQHAVVSPAEMFLQALLRSVELC